MSAKYVDYYQTLGIARGATAEEIQRAYRKLAREFHPDVNKTPGADKRFKEVGEAYEVLKDAEKRKLYDELGNNWKSGQEFRPPPGWRPRAGQGAAGGGFRTRGGDEQTFDFSGFEGGGFSDFFESIFGGSRPGSGSGGGGDFDPEDFLNRSGGKSGRPRASRQSRQPRPRAGSDQEVTITIPLTDAFHGATRKLTLTSTDPSGEERTRTYDVKIPPGVTDGSVIRLSGQGEPGQAGGAAGDLLLRINLSPDPRFRLEQPDEGAGSGHNLITIVPIQPWEAALGAKVSVPTPSGDILMTIPPGSQSGQKLRIRGKGLPRKSGEHGDLFAELKIVVPRALTPEERAAYEQLAVASKPPAPTSE